MVISSFFGFIYHHVYSHEINDYKTSMASLQSALTSKDERITALSNKIDDLSKTINTPLTTTAPSSIIAATEPAKNDPCNSTPAVFAFNSGQVEGLDLKGLEEDNYPKVFNTDPCVNASSGTPQKPSGPLHAYIKDLYIGKIVPAQNNQNKAVR